MKTKRISSKLWLQKVAKKLPGMVNADKRMFDTRLNAGYQHNAKGMSKSFGIPRRIYRRVCRSYRQIFGYRGYQECAFLVGFAVGWIEAKKR